MSDSSHNSTTDESEGEDVSHMLRLESEKDDVDVSDSCSVTIDLATTEKRLMSNIQHTWYNQKSMRMLPASDLPEANIAILW